MKTFISDANSVLQEKGYKKHCHPLDALSKVVETNSKYATAKICFYKWSGLFLLTSIPLISALLSVLVSLKGGGSTWPETTVLPLSLFLTVFTILNSIFKPSERFRQACHIGIRIDRFKADFLMALERLPKIDDSNLLELVDNKRKEFEKYQEELIGMFMPMEIAAQQGAPADVKMRRG